MERLWGAVRWAALLLVLPGTAWGQGWVVDASAGAAEYEAVAGDVGSVNAMIGVRREGSKWLTVSAGIPLDSAGIPWVVGGAGARWSRPAGPVEVGIDAAGFGFGYRTTDPEATGGGATGIGLPFVSFAIPRGRVELHSGVQHHTSFFDGDETSRTVLDSGARALLALRHGFTLAGEGRVVSASEASYPYAGGSLEWTRGKLGAWLSAGRWMADELDEAGWGIGARMALPGRLALRAAYEREPQDPLYWNGSRDSWSVGVSRALGRRAPSESALPSPEPFRTETGSVVLRVTRAESSEAPSVSGDFTEWQPVPMELRDGVWEATFTLDPGVYHFSFRRSDGSWFLPDSVRNRVDDGFGGMNGVLVVAGP